MNSEFSAPLTPGFAGLEKHRDDALASALRRVYNRLQPSACTAFLLGSDPRKLVAAMTVNSPLSFTITHEVDLGNLAWPVVRAFETGKPTVSDETELQSLTRQWPELLVTNPSPMVLIVAPIRTSHHRFGVISLRYVPPRVTVNEELEFLQTAADALAVDLESLAGKGVPIKGPPIPLFISSGPGPPTAGAPVAVQQHRQATTSPSTPGSPFLYQLQQLATELTAAVHTKDVLAITQTQIVRPFGGRAVALCLVEEEALHVVGAAGPSRDVLNRIEGMPLSQHSPECEAITNVAVKIFTSINELRQKYPGIHLNPENQARAYFPLISKGRAVGCCVMEFAEPGTPLTPEEVAVLTVMLEQAGQSLERARSYEIEHALTETIQRSLLPRTLPHLPEIATTARYFPAIEEAAVGASWYDCLTLPDSGIGLVIGDVEGHSLEAVPVMGQLRSGVRAYAAEGHDPSSVLERSNWLLRGLDTDLQATCCCVWLDLATGIASTAAAGHHGPVISNVQGQITQPPLPTGQPLGAGPQSTYQQSEFQMQMGSVAALFTNGLLDSRRLGTGAAVRHLARLLADNCGEDLERLADHLIQICRPQAASCDDAALLLARYEGAQARDRPRVARMSIQRHDLHEVVHVRRFLRDLLQRWELSALVDDVELLVTEVVTNALIHAHSKVDLRLREYADRIRVEVRDSDPYPPVPTALLNDESSNPEAESGRGLLIVDALAFAWGSSPAGRGKTTWFEIGVPAPGRSFQSDRSLGLVESLS